MTVPNARAAAISLRMNSCLQQAIPWAGTIFRATTVKYANRRNLFLGRGAQQFGGRWNPPRVFRAVYGCLDPETALAEALAYSREFAIPVSQAMPLVFVAADIRVQAVLDLTSEKVLRSLGTTVTELTTENWRAIQKQGQESLTQTIGRLAWEGDVEGMLVPSARRSGATNIVLFPSRRRRNSSWRIWGARRLPKSP